MNRFRWAAFRLSTLRYQESLSSSTMTSRTILSMATSSENSLEGQYQEKSPIPGSPVNWWTNVFAARCAHQEKPTKVGLDWDVSKSSGSCNRQRRLPIAVFGHIHS